MNSFLAHDYDGYAQEIIMSKFLSQQGNIVSHAMVLAVVTEEGKYRGCKIIVPRRSCDCSRRSGNDNK